MSVLKIGDRLLDGDQVISALVQYKLLEPLVGQVLLDAVLNDVPLSHLEVFQVLMGDRQSEPPADFQQFFSQWCQQNDVTPAYFTGVILRELRIKKLKQQLFASQVESEFLRQKVHLDQVEYSLIQCSELLLAQELYFQLRDDGADFASLAQRYSIGPEAETGGWIGPVALSSLPFEIVTLFRGGQSQTVYGPFPVDDRFWVVRLEHLHKARLTDITRADLMNRLYDQWLNAQVQKFIATPGAIAVQTDDRPEVSANTESTPFS